MHHAWRLAATARPAADTEGVFDIRAVQGLASEPAQASHGLACGAQVHLFDLHVAFGPGYYFSVFDSQPAAWPNPNYHQLPKRDGV